MHYLGPTPTVGGNKGALTTLVLGVETLVIACDLRMMSNTRGLSLFLNSPYDVPDIVLLYDS